MVCAARGLQFPLAFALVMRLAGSVSAQEPDRDLAFARALVDRGWEVIAERVIEKAEQGAKAADKGRYRLLRARLVLLSARGTAGSAARGEALKQALALIDLLLAEAVSSTPGGASARSDSAAAVELGDFLTGGASILAEEAQRETEAQKAGDLRKRALAMLAAAEKIFSERLEAARRAAAARDGSAEEAEDEEGLSGPSREEMEAAYNLARARFERGMIVETKTEKETALKAVVRDLDDFQVSYQGTPLAYQAAILVGQCWNTLEDSRRAMEAFEVAASLIDLFRNPATGQVRVDHPMAADIIQRALLFKAQAANTQRQGQPARPKDAQEAVDRALKIFPEIRRRPIGYALRIEGARALGRQGKYTEAQKALEEIERDDREGPGGAAARQVLTEFIGRGQSGAGATEAAIVGILERGDVPGAIRASRRALAQFEASPKGKADERVPPVLLMLARAYFEGERYREAALAYEDFLDRYAEHKLAPQAAFQAVSARLRANAKASSKHDLEKKDLNLRTLTEKYPRSPEAGAGKYLQAEELMEAGKHEEASKAYLAVPASAGQYHDQALYQAGFAVYLQAARAPAKGSRPLYERAVKLFEECLARVEREEAGLTPERIQNRKKLRLAARLRLADIHSNLAMKNYAKAWETIQAIEREDEPTAEEAGQLHQARVRTLAALGRIEDAVQGLKALRESHPQARTIPSLCLDLGVAFDGLASKAQAKSPEEYRALGASALEHYAAWIDESARFRQAVSPVAAAKAAERGLALALELSGLPEGKDSFTDAVGRSDLPRTAWERVVKILEAAKPGQKGGEAAGWIPLAKLGRAYGFTGDWAKARAALEEALVFGGLLATTGEALPNPRFEALEKAPDLLDLFIDLGFAELLPARKGGLARAKTIFEKAFPRCERESCAFWKCRYGYIAAEFREGNYDSADGQLRTIQLAFPEWDGGKCGLKELFDALRKDLDAKLPGSGKAKAKAKE